MAIRMMVSKEHAESVGYVNIEVVINYSGAEVGRVNHYCDKCDKSNTYDLSGVKGEGCCSGSVYGDNPKKPTCGKDYCSGCWVNHKPLYMETTHIGVVLECREYNGRDDSDFYAIVWNDEKECTERVEYATTRGWTYPNGASVDATPEVVAKWEAWSRKCQEARRVAYEAQEAATPTHGKTVKVVKGRKVPIGTVGEVYWSGKCQYSGNLRLGIRLTNGDKVFTAGSNVVVVQ